MSEMNSTCLYTSTRAGVTTQSTPNANRYPPNIRIYSGFCSSRSGNRDEYQLEYIPKFG